MIYRYKIDYVDDNGDVILNVLDIIRFGHVDLLPYLLQLPKMINCEDIQASKENIFTGLTKVTTRSYKIMYKDGKLY